MNFLNSIQSKLHGAVNPNSVQYIKQQDLQVQLDPSGTAYVDHGNQAFSLNVDDENTTALAILDKAPSTQPLSLSGQSQFTICLKHKVQDATNPLIGQYYTNPQYDLSLSSTVVGTLDTVQVNVFNASDDPVSYSITGGLTSADLSNADLTGTLTNLYTPLSYTLRSGYGNFVFGLDGLSQQVSATVYQKYWVKSVTNLLGELVFGFSSTGSAGDYLNQPDLSFGAGGKYMFDVSDPTMTDLSLVFGTTVDDISTVNNSVVTRTNDLITLDISAGYDGDRLVYFEDSSAGMGYVSSSGSASGTAPQLLNNSFESSSLVGSSDTFQIYYGNTNIDNWTTIGPNDNTNRTFIIRDNDTAGFNFPTPFVNGSYCMALGYQYHAGLIQTGYLQQIITLPVNNYILSWYDVLRTYPGMDSEPIRIKITKDEDSTVIHTHEYLVTNKAWTEKTTSFSITEEANYIVSFESYDYNNMYGQTAFDNVTFSIAPPPVENYTVDVSNSVFRLNSGDGNGFVEKLAVAFNSGTTYIFDQSDSTNTGNTLIIGTAPDISSSIVSSGLTIMGTPGQAGAYTKYVSDGSTVYYFSYQTENMGEEPLIYTVKVVDHEITGEKVFSFKSPGTSTFINQPDLSFGAGDKYQFDVTHSTMADISLVFGTTVDDISTRNESVVTRYEGMILLDISAGYDGDRLVYFEDSSSNMGYVASGGGGGDSDAVINLSFDTDGTNSGSYGSSGDITITHDTIDTANAKYGNGALYINSSGETSANYVKSTISTVFSSIPQNWCISLWMKASAWVGTNHNIISALTTEGGLVIGFNTANYLLLFLNGEYVPPAGTNIPSDIDPFDNTYHHYFFKIEGQLLTAYIDGTEITSINFTKSNNVLPGNTLSNFSVGDSRTADSSATMYYDDVRIFDKIVSIDEAKKEIPLTVPYIVDVSNGVFRLDSGSGFVEKPAIDFANNSGTVYIFDQSDSTNAGNTLVIGSFDVSSSIVSSGLTIMGTPGQPGAYTKYVSDGSTVHYFSYQTENMGTASPPPNINDDLYVHYDFEFPLYDPNGTERTDGLTGNNTDVRVYNKAYDSSTNSDISYNGYLAPFGNGGGARLDSTVQKIGSSSVKIYESAVRSEFVWNLDSLQGFSMCIWMKEESASGNLMGAGSPLVFEISYNNSTFTVNISGTTMSYTYTNSDITNITDWNHIAFTMSSDGKTWKLYINGNLVQTKTDGIYFTQTGTINYVDIGAKPGSSTYIGYFDDFRFYKTEISQAHVSAVYSYTG